MKLTLKNFLSIASLRSRGKQSVLSAPRSKVEYFTYADLPLRTYFHIQETKNFNLLSKTGIVDESVTIAWETIIKASERDADRAEYANRISDLKDVARLISDYVIVRASLYKLLYQVDRAVIADIRTRGYIVDVANGDAAYAVSVANNLRTVTNLITKLEMKRKRIEAENNDPGTIVSFDSAMSALSIELGFAVPEDVTLRRYNEYYKQLKTRRKPQPEEING